MAIQCFWGKGLKFFRNYLKMYKDFDTLSSNWLCTSSVYTRRRLQYTNDNAITEQDIEENFVKGSGPGGQKVNKTNNCVFLRHKPTGIMVKCHQSRSQAQNRLIARQLLLDKLRLFESGSDSHACTQVVKQRKRKITSKSRTRKKLEILNKADVAGNSR